MAVTQYIGARYVPLFANPAEWDSSREYEPLTIVLYQGASYTSKQAVPSGIAITDENFWARTGDYNAQVEQYRQEVRTFDGRITTNANNITALQTDIADEETARIAADDDLQDAIDAEETTRTSADAVLQDNIDAEETARIAADTTLQNNIDAEEAARIAADANLANELEEVIDNEIAPLKLKNMKGLKVVTIGDSYGRGVGSDNDRGWPYYMSVDSGMGYLRNVSNSGAGFVALGHSTDLPSSGAINFNGQVNYAAESLASGTAFDTSINVNELTGEDIDLVVIAGGYNDHGRSGLDNAIEACIANAQNKFPNAKICFYPLVAADHDLDNEFLGTYWDMCYYAAKMGIYVNNDSIFWLHPYQNQTSYGDGIHPNNYGYRIIGRAINATCMGGTWTGYTYTMGQRAEGYYMCDSSGASNWDADHPGNTGYVPNNGISTGQYGFRCGVQNGMAWLKGGFNITGYGPTGKGELCLLPTYLRPASGRTFYFLAFYYASGSHGVARMRVVSSGWLQFYGVESGDFNENTRYEIFLPFMTYPVGHY